MIFELLVRCGGPRANCRGGISEEFIRNMEARQQLWHDNEQAALVLMACGFIILVAILYKIVSP